MSLKVKIWLGMLSIYTVWGSTYLAIRFAVETLPPFLMAATRHLTAGLIIFTWMRLSGAPKPTVKQWKTTGVVGLFLLLGGNGFVSWAEQHVVSGVAAVLVGSVPLWIVLFDSFRQGGRRPSWQTVAGALIGFAGIVILINPLGQGDSSQSIHKMGALMLLIAALSWSIGSIYSRENHDNMPKQPMLASGMELIVGGAGLLVTGTIFGEWSKLNLAAISSNSLLGLGYLIVFGSLVGFASYSWLLGVAPTPLVSTYAYVNPLVAVVLGNLLAQEPLNLRIILATLLIVGAVVMINTTSALRVIRSPASSARKPAPVSKNPSTPISVASDGCSASED
jgi:drug/metabolite transporter (DMT)-like permease